MKHKHDESNKENILILDDPEICPDCETRSIIMDYEKGEEYCTHCGLITRAPYKYVAGNSFELAYGLIIK